MAKVDITNTDNLRKGTDFTIGFTVKDAAGAVVDISGWSLTYTWKVRESDATAILTKTVGSGILLSDPTNGEGTISLTAADTSDLRPRVYNHSLERTDTGLAGSVIPGEGHPSALVILRP